MDAPSISFVDGPLEEGSYKFRPRESTDLGNINSLVEIVFSTLRRLRKTLALVETFTGGMISDLLVSTPNMSEIFLGSLVAYRPSSYQHLLDIPETYVNNVGIVSKEITATLAQSGALTFNSNYALASTGIAGPGGDSPATPIGRGWLAIKAPARLIVQPFDFSDIVHDRNLIRENATYACLKMLVQVIFEDVNQAANAIQPS